MLKVIIEEKNIWKRLYSADASLWFKGYLYNQSPEELLSDLESLQFDCIEGYLKKLNGHFAFVYQNENFTLSVVDKVRSIPVFYDLYSVSSNPHCLRFGSQINQNAVISLKMSGYTIGADTLYSDLNSLIAGEYCYEMGGKIERRSYFRYEPWVKSNQEINSDDLSEVTLNILKKLIQNLKGRQIVVPLSAGNDSRLIASGLKHLGYENVKCYSYGIPGNFEAKVAEVIANKLGYDFRFVPLNLFSERKFYRSKEFKEYLEFAETYVSVPYFQSLSSISKLRDWIDKDAVFVNGNTGDFISGGHINSHYFNQRNPKKEGDRVDIVNEANIYKNFSLWGFLKNSKNLIRIKDQLNDEIPLNIQDIEIGREYGLYEYSEYRNRQSKYVISGQRAYEFYGYEWRLPLWDDAYIEFWEKVPLQLKINQKLYTDMLKTKNWCEVWDESVPVNRRTIRPYWLIPIRTILKGFFLLFGKKRWHRFETIILYYLMDVTRMMCSLDYLTVLRSAFKHPRHHVSWQAEKYLKSKNIQ